MLPPLPGECEAGELPGDWLLVGNMSVTCDSEKILHEHERENIEGYIFAIFVSS